MAEDELTFNGLTYILKQKYNNLSRQLTEARAKLAESESLLTEAKERDKIHVGHLEYKDKRIAELEVSLAEAKAIAESRREALAATVDGTVMMEAAKMIGGQRERIAELEAELEEKDKALLARKEQSDKLMAMVESTEAKLAAAKDAEKRGGCLCIVCEIMDNGGIDCECKKHLRNIDDQRKRTASLEAQLENANHRAVAYASQSDKFAERNKELEEISDDWKKVATENADEVKRLTELSGDVLQALHNWDPTADACSITLDAAVEKLELLLKPSEGGMAGNGVQGEPVTAFPPVSSGWGSSAHETSAPHTPEGLHIPTLIKLKEIIDSDEELHSCIASGDGWSIIDGILDRLIKPPAAVSEGEPQVAEGEKKAPETRKGDEAVQGDAARPLIPPASAESAGDQCTTCKGVKSLSHALCPDCTILCGGDESNPCDFRTYAGASTICMRKRGVCKHQYSQTDIEKLWNWLDRPLPDEFFTDKIPDGQHQQRADAIPLPYRPLAKIIYDLAIERQKAGRGGKCAGACREFRHLLFIIIKDSKDKYPLPYYWSTDGVMVEPEWIVRLTNGLVKWTCDDSVSDCGAIDGLLQCRFCELPRGKK